MSKSVVLGACALGLVLLAGCTIYVGDSDPPPEPLPPPPPPPPPPPSDPPPPMGTNVSGDRYDPAHHRLLLSDCPNNALIALDLATGERSVVIDTWPWTEPGNEPCVGGIVVDRDGRRVYATVKRVFPDSTGTSICRADVLVAIDLETREVTPMKEIDFSCGSEEYYSYLSLQIDAHGGRLLYIDSTSGGEGITIDSLASVPLPGGATGPALQRNLSGDCYPDQTGCEGETWANIGRFMFDPAAPDERLLMLARQYIIGQPASGDYLLDTRDIATGATIARLPLLVSGPLAGISLDAEKQRMLFTRDVEGQWSVIALDLVTGEETVLHDGSPTADGQQLACSPNTAFDARERRLLLIEPIGGFDDCTNGVFAVDADTGAFTQIAGRIE
jgi:hypothetical protein